MRLVYKSTQQPVEIGDNITLDNQPAKVDYFRKPHKPASEGFVRIRYINDPTQTREFYVSVIGAEWIEREDRA